MDTKLLIILFLFGLVAGSFLNVLARRYIPADGFFGKWDISGRSRCPSCGKTLRWFELVPLASFVFLRGRCGGCKGKISLQYPAVELLSGLVFVFVPVFLFNFFTPLFISVPFWFFLLIAIWILIFLVVILLSAIDLEQYIIPNELNLLLFVLGIVLIPLMLYGAEQLAPFSESFLKHYALVFQISESFVINKALGFVFGVLFFGGIIALTKARAMGPGDGKLAGAFGIILGWPDMVLASFLAFIFGGAWGIYLILSKKKGFKDKVPFGPFLSAGLILTFFAGSLIVGTYFRLFGF